MRERAAGHDLEMIRSAPDQDDLRAGDQRLGTVATGLHPKTINDLIGGSEISPVKFAPRRTMLISRGGGGQSLAWVTALPSHFAWWEALR